MSGLSVPVLPFPMLNGEWMWRNRTGPREDYDIDLDARDIGKKAQLPSRVDRK